MDTNQERVDDVADQEAARMQRKMVIAVILSVAIAAVQAWMLFRSASPGVRWLAFFLLGQVALFAKLTTMWQERTWAALRGWRATLARISVPPRPAREPLTKPVTFVLSRLDVASALTDWVIAHRIPPVLGGWNATVATAVDGQATVTVEPAQVEGAPAVWLAANVAHRKKIEEKPN